MNMMNRKYIIVLILLFLSIVTFYAALKNPELKSKNVDSSSQVLEKEREEWFMVTLETWIPNKTAFKKNTEVAVRNNYTVPVYNITVQLIWEGQIFEWSYTAKRTSYNLTCILPNEHEWLYRYLTDECIEHTLIAHAQGWRKCSYKN